jgi:hypothetical protein
MDRAHFLELSAILGYLEQHGVVHWCNDGECVFRGKSATDSGMKSATDSDLISAIPI